MLPEPGTGTLGSTLAVGSCNADAAIGSAARCSRRDSGAESEAGLLMDTPSAALRCFVPDSSP